MNRQRFVLLLIAALVVICGAFYLSSQRNLTRQTQGVAFLPSLDKDFNAVSTVMVRKGSATPTSTLHKKGNQWLVAERADYPADVVKLRKLLLALRDARIIEEKTSDPGRFASIGVEDPGEAAASGAEITLVGPAAKHSVIVGKPVGGGNFVRRVGENRSYSVEPGIPVETEPKDWIDARLIDVAVALIQSIEIKTGAGAPATGGGYTIRRLNPADNTFSLDGVPAGRKPIDGHTLAPAPTTLAALNVEDVAPSSDIDFGHSSQAIVALTDGNVITLTGAVIADKHWIQVKSTKDTELTAKTLGRAFEVASYRYDAIFKPVEQLLVPKEPPATKGAPATKSAPAAKTSSAVPSPAPKKRAPNPAP